MMDVLDMHTHTLASGHAYNTITEMVREAQSLGLSALGITEHAPAMAGSCSAIYFNNLRVIPREMLGVRLYLGCELNILDFDGNVDLPEHILKEMDICIASIHLPCYPSKSTKEENTLAVINAMKNPYVHIIGHPDDGRYPLDYELVAAEAKRRGVLLELNNSSVLPTTFRQNARENILTLLHYCKQYETAVIMNSDAHIFTQIGNHSIVAGLIEQADFPKELVVNQSVECLEKFLRRTKD